MTPITNAERLVWQHQAHTVLGRLLARATTEHLPPIPWTVSPRLSLRGECSPYDEDPGAEFAAWMAALGTPDSKRMKREEGVTRRTAVWERYEGTQIVLTAAVYDEPAGDDE